MFIPLSVHKDSSRVQAPALPIHIQETYPHVLVVKCAIRGSFLISHNEKRIGKLLHSVTAVQNLVVLKQYGNSDLCSFFMSFI